MELTLLDEAIELLEKANADLEPELLRAPQARALLKRYARAERLAAFGVAALARKLDDAQELAHVTGVSLGKAKGTVQTGRTLGTSQDLSAALRSGKISLDQASEIAKAEESRPGAAKQLLPVAQKEAFHVLKDRARELKLEAEQHHGLADRERAARFGRHYSDELGMVHVHLALEPHIGAPIVSRAEAAAARLARKAKKEGNPEPFERHLADGYAALLAGSGRGTSRRPELVVLVSHEVAKRGWVDVKKGEVCKIPGIGPIAPQAAKKIADDAFLNGVFFDGVDLRQFNRWSRNTPIKVRVALELGQPPRFDGVVCVDCGNRFRTEFDHVDPHTAGGPASNGNLRPRCWPCHQAKTKLDRRAGRLRPSGRHPMVKSARRATRARRAGKARSAEP